MPGQSTPFDVSSKTVDGATVVKVRGELDIDTHERLSAALMPEAERGPVVVDMSSCGFIDSSGVRALLLAISAAGERGDGLRGIAVAGPSPQVARILELTGLSGTVPIRASVAEAVAALGAG